MKGRRLQLIKYPNLSQGRPNMSPAEKRHLETDKHHPFHRRYPRIPHTAWPKPPFPEDHDPHSHIHGDELGWHTNQPGPIKDEPTITPKGRKPGKWYTYKKRNDRLIE
ncbi:hypothetical protein [Methanovulcanius yangii]|uniref:hypothetical protein n=1 Tax=Methanovulcanius yangii TaxID=1789227 RepID=UPI0029CA2002|nr:hypothetical protein [Methanovulcanius yangii]